MTSMSFKTLLRMLISGVVSAENVGLPSGTKEKRTVKATILTSSILGPLITIMTCRTIKTKAFSDSK